MPLFEWVYYSLEADACYGVVLTQNRVIFAFRQSHLDIQAPGSTVYTCGRLTLFMAGFAVFAKVTAFVGRAWCRYVARDSG